MLAQSLNLQLHSFVYLFFFLFYTLLAWLLYPCYNKLINSWIWQQLASKHLCLLVSSDWKFLTVISSPNCNILSSADMLWQKNSVKQLLLTFLKVCLHTAYSYRLLAYLHVLHLHTWKTANNLIIDICRKKTKSKTYSTKAGGSRRAGRSRQSRLAGHTIVTRGTRKTLQLGGGQKQK